MREPPAHRYVNPLDVWDSTPHGFSQAVVAGRGETIHVSGQVDWDADRRIGSEDLGLQAKGALANLERVLNASDAALEDVVSLRLYIVAEPEADLSGVPDDRLGEVALEHLEPADDIHATAEYRAQLVRVLTARVVRSARGFVHE